MDLVLTVTVALGVALALGFVARRLGLSPTVGYLAAGVVVGPFTPGFVAHAELTSQLAEVGIILLMFVGGLGFKLEELVAVRRLATAGACIGVAAATLLGALVARAFGWPASAAIVYGLAISVGSTVVLLRVLEEDAPLRERAGKVAMGWLVVEDVLTVVMLVLLPLLLGGDRAASTGATATAVAIALAKVAALVAVAATVGKRAVAVVLGRVASTRSRELFTLAVLVIALGAAVGAARLLGVSLALGAFAAGVLVGRSELGDRATSEAVPMRNAFAVLFFLSVGMLFDPAALAKNAALVASTLAVVLVGKPLAVFIVLRVARHPPPVATATAGLFAQIGEFSFVITVVGRKLGVLPESATQAIVVVSMVSIALSSVLVRVSTTAIRRVAPHLEPRRARIPARARAKLSPLARD